MTETIRAFIAIELNDDIRRALGDLQTQLKAERAARYVRWVAPDGIHITLKFLGDVSADRMPAVQRAITDACAGTPPFTLTLRGIGAFPNARRPNVVWVGAEGEVEIAGELAKKIDDACVVLGFAPEGRPFAAHLTIGRIKRDASPNDRAFVGEMIANTQVAALGELRTERVSVMKSELKPGGSVYTRLHEVRLAGYAFPRPL